MHQTRSFNFRLNRNNENDEKLLKVSFGIVIPIEDTPLLTGCLKHKCVVLKLGLYLGYAAFNTRLVCAFELAAMITLRTLIRIGFQGEGKYEESKVFSVTVETPSRCILWL